MSESSSPRAIDVRQLKSQAKDLRRAAQAQEPQALTRVRSNHPRHAAIEPESLPGLTLQDALVIAREHGHASWPRLVAACASASHLDGPGGIDGVIGGSLEGLRGRLRRSLSAKVAPAVITGEAGTGKRFLARAMADHLGCDLYHVDCEANPGAVGESLIFGYQAGAFTGAHQDTAGALETAAGGIVLLTEAGHLSPRAQSWLAEALDTGSYRRMGSQESLPFSVRLVCTSTTDLQVLVDEGGFRRDLFHHLQVVSALLPPLADRRSDIPELARHFVQGLRPQACLTDAAVARLQAHDWPGNVRELRHVMEAASLAAETDTVDASSIGLPSPADAPA